MRRSALALTVLSSLVALGACGAKNAASDASLASGTGASPAPSVAAAVPAGVGLVSVTTDVSRVAPALDSYYRTNGYPTTLEDVARSMPKANLTMDPANALASYRLDPAAKQFRLCVENDAGSWATYDTAVNTIADHGLTGGCPQS